MRRPLLAPAGQPRLQEIHLTPQEAARRLIIGMNIHEGYWRVFVTFGSSIGLNANINGRLSPAGMLPIMEFGLVQEDPAHLTTLAVDAAAINPRPM